MDVIELCKAFRDNRTHHRDHLKNIITNNLKQMILKNWKDEVEFNQRTLYNFMIELEYLEYFDKQIWELVFETISHKKRINNITYFTYFHKMMEQFNSDPKSAFFKKLDQNIQKLKERHYTVNRQWRYDFNEG
jgi:hypothetical protein